MNILVTDRHPLGRPRDLSVRGAIPKPLRPRQPQWCHLLVAAGNGVLRVLPRGRSQTDSWPVCCASFEDSDGSTRALSGASWSEGTVTNWKQILTKRPPEQSWERVWFGPWEFVSSCRPRLRYYRCAKPKMNCDCFYWRCFQPRQSLVFPTCWSIDRFCVVRC